MYSICYSIWQDEQGMRMNRMIRLLSIALMMIYAGIGAPAQAMRCLQAPGATETGLFDSPPAIPPDAGIATTGHHISQAKERLRNLTTAWNRTDGPIAEELASLSETLADLHRSATGSPAPDVRELFLHCYFIEAHITDIFAAINNHGTRPQDGGEFAKEAMSYKEHSNDFMRCADAATASLAGALTALADTCGAQVTPTDTGMPAVRIDHRSLAAWAPYLKTYYQGIVMAHLLCERIAPLHVMAETSACTAEGKGHGMIEIGEQAAASTGHDDFAEKDPGDFDEFGEFGEFGDGLPANSFEDEGLSSRNTPVAAALSWMDYELDETAPLPIIRFTTLQTSDGSTLLVAVVPDAQFPIPLDTEAAKPKPSPRSVNPDDSL